MQSLSPADSARMIAEGAILIDVREADEFRRGYIEGAINAPLSRFTPSDVPPGDAPVIFQCRSGARTAANCSRLGQGLMRNAYLMAGGLDNWRKAGLPVHEVAGQPLEIMRQAQIVAGGFGLLGFLLGIFVHPGFHVLSGFIGAGLLFAGLSGFCGMAHLLALAPWNRPRAVA